MTCSPPVDYFLLPGGIQDLTGSSDLNNLGCIQFLPGESAGRLATLSPSCASPYLPAESASEIQKY